MLPAFTGLILEFRICIMMPDVFIIHLLIFILSSIRRKWNDEVTQWQVLQPIFTSGHLSAGS